MHQRTTKGTAATQVPARTLMAEGSGSQAYEYIRRLWTKWQFRIRAAYTMAFSVTRADYITSQSTYMHHYSLSRQEQVRGSFVRSTCWIRIVAVSLCTRSSFSNNQLHLHIPSTREEHHVQLQGL